MALIYDAGCYAFFVLAKLRRGTSLTSFGYPPVYRQTAVRYAIISLGEVIHSSPRYDLTESISPIHLNRSLLRSSSPCPRSPFRGHANEM